MTTSEQLEIYLRDTVKMAQHVLQQKTSIHKLNRPPTEGFYHLQPPFN